MEHDGEMAPPIPSHANAADADAAADDWAARDDFEEPPAGSHSHPPAAAAAAAAAEEEAREEAPPAPPAEGIPRPFPDFLLRCCVVAGSERWI
jgi:peptide chain release factor subunit 3